MSHVIIIAGPNGAGKTTTAPALLNEALTIWKTLMETYDETSKTR